ncbi:MAG: TusE/DsrC/DsvC family sulfur relay protein [Proteobacteria bacterium]|nr:TusE/DsrC/DsvC family sulfur relay protein [Pseudomonadota bacterium]
MNGSETESGRRPEPETSPDSEKALSVDPEGFLQRLTDWTPDAAARLASDADIILTPDHWEVIDLVRDYYSAHRVSPPARVIVRLIRNKLGKEKGTSLYLMKLFGGRPAREVNKIAGLPKPTNCD